MKPRTIRTRARYRPSLTDDLLALLVDRKAPYRILHNLLKERYTAAFRAMPTDAVLRATLSRLKRNELVATKDGMWLAAKKGLARSRLTRRLIRVPHPKAAASRPKSMIVLYDIPQSEKWKREWLRSELTALGFTMLQKSAWFGPAPLPKAFLEAAHAIGALSYIRFFSAKEEEIA